MCLCEPSLRCSRCSRSDWLGEHLMADLPHLVRFLGAGHSPVSVSGPPSGMSVQPQLIRATYFSNQAKALSMNTEPSSTTGVPCAIRTRLHCHALIRRNASRAAALSKKANLNFRGTCGMVPVMRSKAPQVPATRETSPVGSSEAGQRREPSDSRNGRRRPRR